MNEFVAGVVVVDGTAAVVDIVAFVAVAHDVEERRVCEQLFGSVFI